MLSNLKKFFLELFFPKSCLGCKQPGTYLCRDCFNKIRLADNNLCFFCEKPTGAGRICFECKTENFLDRIISAAEYKEPLVRDLIKAYKYHFVTELAEPLSQLIIKQLENLKLEIRNSDFLLIPIPLHRHRLHYRGFNQAQLIAVKLAEYFKIAHKPDILQRKTSTTPQAKIKDTEKRKINLKNTFCINPEFAQEIKGKTILLIDDVITTGATMAEAAKILKENNAKEVWALTIAKG